MHNNTLSLFLVHSLCHERLKIIILALGRSSLSRSSGQNRPFAGTSSSSSCPVSELSDSVFAFCWLREWLHNPLNIPVLLLLVPSGNDELSEADDGELE